MFVCIQYGLAAFRGNKFMQIALKPLLMLSMEKEEVW